MSSKPCRNCRSLVNPKTKVCPHCGARAPAAGRWASLPPQVKVGLKVAIGLVVLVWMVVQVFDTSDPYKQPVAGARDGADDAAPPRVPNSMDASQSHLQAKAIWVVQTLRSANKAQICGLRGHMWATRMVDEVFAAADREKQKLRKESTDPKGFDAYAKTLVDWEMRRIQPKPPTEYECAAMSRGQEIDMLIKTEAALKDAQ